MPALASYLEGLLSSEEHADVTIDMGTESEPLSVKVHALILRRSEYFQTALPSAFKEGLTKVITITDANPKLLSLLIKLLYTDTLPTASEVTTFQLLEMLELCRRFMFPRVTTSGLLAIAASKVRLGENVLRMVAKAYDLDFPDAADSFLNEITADSISMQKLQYEMAAASDHEGIVKDVSISEARVASCKRLLGLLLTSPSPTIQLPNASSLQPDTFKVVRNGLNVSVSAVPQNLAADFVNASKRAAAKAKDDFEKHQKMLFFLVNMMGTEVSQV